MLLPSRFGPDSKQGVGEPFAACRQGCCTESGRLVHAKTVHVGASLTRNLVDYPVAPSEFAPTHVFCGNSAMNRTRVSPRLVKRGDNAELIEFVHLLRFLSLSCGPVVSTAAAGQKRLQPCEPKALLVAKPDPPAHDRAVGRCVGARGLRAQLFFDRRARGAAI
jgi:hypothetical protein